MSHYLDSLTPSEKAEHLSRIESITIAISCGEKVSEEDARWMTQVFRSAVANGDEPTEEALNEFMIIEKSLDDGTFKGVLS